MMSQRFRQQRACPPGKAAPADYLHESQNAPVRRHAKDWLLAPSRAILKQMTHS